MTRRFGIYGYLLAARSPSYVLATTNLTPSVRLPRREPLLRTLASLLYSTRLGLDLCNLGSDQLDSPFGDFDPTLNSTTPYPAYSYACTLQPLNRAPPVATTRWDRYHRGPRSSYARQDSLADFGRATP